MSPTSMAPGVYTTFGVSDHKVASRFGKNDQMTKWMTQDPADDIDEKVAEDVSEVGAAVQCRRLKLKATFESSSSQFGFNA